MKFLLHFAFGFVALLAIVFLGTGFDTAMSFSWYSYTIVGVLSVFYALTKTIRLDKLTDDDTDTKKASAIPGHYSQHRPYQTKAAHTASNQSQNADQRHHNEPRIDKDSQENP